MLITDDSDWIELDAPPKNVVVTTSPSTSTLTHRNPTGGHTKDETATATTTTTSTSTSTSTSTEIPLPISDLKLRIRHLCDTWQITWTNHKQHRITSRIRTFIQHLRAWLHHTTTRDWQQITGWLYVPYPKLCDGFFYFLLFGMCLVSSFSLLHKYISFTGMWATPLLITMGVWNIIYILLITCLIIGHAAFTIREWWYPSVYVIPIPTIHVIPYNCTTLALLLTLMCMILGSLISTSPKDYIHIIHHTLLICTCGYPVWRGWYDIQSHMETLHIYYTGMGDITRLQVKYIEKQQQQQHQQQTSPSSPGVTSPNPIPTTTCAALALFLSQLYHSCSYSSPTPPHLPLYRIHLTTWLTCMMVAIYSMIVGMLLIGALLIGNGMN